MVVESFSEGTNDRVSVNINLGAKILVNFKNNAISKVINTPVKYKSVLNMAPK